MEKITAAEKQKSKLQKLNHRIFEETQMLKIEQPSLAPTY